MHRIKLIIATLFLISPFAANADPIIYILEGTLELGLGTDSFGLDGAQFTYSVTVDDSTAPTSFNVIPGNLSNTFYQTVVSKIDISGSTIDGSYQSVLGALIIQDRTNGSGNDRILLPTGSLGPLFVNDAQIGFTGDGFISSTMAIPLISFNPADATTSSFGISIGGAIYFSSSTAGNLVAQSTSVPEPGTLALLGLGLASMGFARRRRKV